MPIAPRIIVLLESDQGYNRKVIRGLARHARIHGLGTFLRSGLIPEPSALEGFGAVGAVASVTSRRVLRDLKALSMPVVNISNWLGDLPVATVCPDNLQIGQMAAEYFMGRQFRRVAFYGGQSRAYVNDRRHAFSDSLAQKGIEMINLPAAGYSQNWREQIQQMAATLKAMSKPMGVFCANDEEGRHIIEICRRGQIHVPDEISVLGVDNDEMLCEISAPPLSSIDTQAERIGYEAAAMLVRLIEGEEGREAILRIPPAGVVERQSSETIAVEDPDVAAALHYIRHHADQPIRVTDVIAATNLSRRTLERRFAETVGRTPSVEIRRQHVERAKYLLSFTDWNLTRIAYGSGFRSFRQLANVFRADLNCSPTQWRKRSNLG